MKKMVSVLVLFGMLLFAAASGFSQTFVAQHGQLRVSGNRIVDKNGQVVILRGMSMYAWAQQGLQFYNATAIGRLVNEWKCTVIRIPILPANVSSQTSLVRTVVDACIANGVYAIIDWHSMTGANASACSSFMQSMASSYGTTPNVMYETWNEPESESWSTVKAYHQQVISAIRTIDPDNIIICGTDQWCQHPNLAAADPITSSVNIAYSMHFYAATHKQWLRDNTTTALNLGAAVFCTEYGSGAADGNGTMDAAETQIWWDFMDANGVGSANWSVSALDETTAAFYTGTSATSWTESNLKPSGVLVKAYLISKNSGAVGPTPSPSRTATRTATTTNKGDVNSSGAVDIVDALMVAQYCVGLNPAGFVAANADVNCSGAIDIVDALMIAQRYIGLISNFPC